MDGQLIDPKNFILAIRDSGYRSTAAAISEIVDNAIEANATSIDIGISRDETASRHTITVLDNGHGMTPSTLSNALRFGGTSRFNSRTGAGRYGMGLPNSSVSQTKRVEVLTWRNPKAGWWNYLDVDEIASGERAEIDKPRRRLPSKSVSGRLSRSGTLVIWRDCDRLSVSRVSTLRQQLDRQLGRIFRIKLLNGIRITVNGSKVLPIDPLFLRGTDLQGKATQFGPEMSFDIRVPNSLEKLMTSKVRVLFSELPLETCYALNDAEKRSVGIARQAGVHIVRAGREIDKGWHFMGRKRRENYDDWWKCEVQFEPELDEMFGVTHTKQYIRPDRQLVDILQPHIEGVAYKLNARVRDKFQKLKDGSKTEASKRAERHDYLLEPPPDVIKKDLIAATAGGPTRLGRNRSVGGLKYRLAEHDAKDRNLYQPALKHDVLTLSLNSEHPFNKNVFSPVGRRRYAESGPSFFVELLLLSASRAELMVKGKAPRKVIREFRVNWSDCLASFMS